MDLKSLTNLYFSNTVEHVDSFKKEEELVANRRSWTNHTTQASNAKATLCCCIDCTWVYFRCLTCKCCGKKKVDGKMSVSHKIAVFESDNKGDSSCFGLNYSKFTERTVADVINAPTLAMQNESKVFCFNCCVISRDEYEIVIPTSLGIYEVGLISDMSTALSGLWPAWEILGSAPFLEGNAEVKSDMHKK